MELLLGSFADEVESSGDVARVLRELVVEGHFACRLVVYAYDRRRIRKGELRVFVVLRAQVLHVIEEHVDVSCGHASGAAGHYFGLATAHGDRYLESRVRFDYSSSVEYEVACGGSSGVWAVLPGCVGENDNLGAGQVVFRDEFVNRALLEGIVKLRSPVGLGAEVSE